VLACTSLPVFLISVATTAAKAVKIFMQSDFLISVAVATASARPVFEMLVAPFIAFMAFIAWAFGAMAAGK